MRKASQDYAIIVDDNGIFSGIALGYDYCAEHEWGIKDLKRECAIPESSKKTMGVKSRTITKTPTFAFKEETYKKRKFAILYTGRSYWGQERLEEHLPHDFKNYKEDLIWNEKWTKEHPNRDSRDNIATAWSESDFGIAVMGEKEVGYLRELKEALEKKNIVIAMIDHRKRNPFAGTSLSIMIADRLPQEIKDAMYRADKEYYDREDYEKKIGMKRIIEKHGNKNGYKGEKYFMACSPKWINYDDEKAREKRKKELGTKYNIQYWVNYSDDDENYGWYTVEQIKKWLTTPKLHLKELNVKEEVS